MNAGRLGTARQLRGVAILIIPAEPHLQGDGNLDGLDGGFDQNERLIEVAHQCAAGRLADDLARRATHVDIDDVSAIAFGNTRTFRHPLRLATNQLYNEGGEIGTFRAAHDVGALGNQFRTGNHFGDH